MMQNVLITLAGSDTPGRVRDLAELVSRCEGNWLQSRLTHLRGQFAGVVDISIPRSNHDTLEAGLVSLRETGLHAQIHTTEKNSASTTNQNHRAHISVVGNDRPGIIASISQALALHAVNVEELHSDVSDAPMASGPLFKSEIDVSCETADQLDAAQDEIESLAHDLMIDITQV